MERKPNILYILADDLGWADVSWHNPVMLTPVLEGLARRGVILDNFYTQPKCSPSRAALMTGLYPYKTSMQRGSIGPFRPTGLPTNIPILPELLKEEGYSTHLVGKWHLGFCNPAYTPTARGFDTFFGEYAQQGDHYTRQHQVNKHIGSGYDLRRDQNVTYEKLGVYSTQLWEEETTQIIEELPTSESKPWYIQLSFTAVHTPYQVPERFVQLYKQAGRSNYNENDLIRMGMVSAIDESVGRIVDRLKTTGHYNNTLVIFTSDNGAGDDKANRPLRGKKGSVYEGGVRVPAFVHGPPLSKHLNTRSRKGVTSLALSHITDMFTTILGRARHKVTLPTDGHDLWPVLISGSSVSLRDSLVYNIDLDDQSETFQFAVRQGRWKLIWGQTEEFRPNKKQAKDSLELYDLAKDPLEQRDLSNTRGDILLKMKGFAKALAKEMKIAFQPNRFSLGFPRYHDGVIETGWCSTGWWKILWNQTNIRVQDFVFRI